VGNERDDEISVQNITINMAGGSGDSNQPVRRSARIAARNNANSSTGIPQSSTVSVDSQSLQNTNIPTNTEKQSQNKTGKRRGRPPKTKIIPNSPGVDQTVIVPPVNPVPGLTQGSPQAPLPIHNYFDRLHKPNPIILNPELLKHVDVKNSDVYGHETLTFLPEPRPLFESNPNVKFCDKFHGSVPPRARDKVRDLACRNYTLDLDKSDIKREQRLDSRYRNLIVYLEHRILPNQKQMAQRIMNQEENFCLIDDLLFRLPRLSDIHNPAKMRLQLVIPDSLADNVIAAKHTKFMGVGHSGFLRSLMAIREKFYIHDLANKLKEFIDKCGLCLKLRNSKKNDTKLPLKITAGKSTMGPFQRLQVDYFGPITSAKHSAKHVLVVVDEFTLYTWLFACDTPNAEETVKALTCLIKAHGVPVQGISSDRGAAFNSKMLSDLSKSFGIKWRHDAAHMPSSTGLVENRVQMAKKLIKFAVLKNPGVDSFDILPDIQFCMNNSPCTSLGVSPYFAFHGFHATDVFENNLNLDTLPGSDFKYVENLVEEAKLRHEMLKEAKKVTADNLKHAHDRKIVSLPELNVGDLVLYSTPSHPLSSKNMRKFKVNKAGPFRIKALEDYSAVLTDMHGNILNDLIPVRKLQKISGYTTTFPADSKFVGETIETDYGYKQNVDNGVVLPITMGSKVKMKGGILHRLCYPFGIKQTGTYLPENLLKLS
jgi:hypothetical protein